MALLVPGVHEEKAIKNILEDYKDLYFIQDQHCHLALMAFIRDTQIPYSNRNYNI